MVCSNVRVNRPVQGNLFSQGLDEGFQSHYISPNSFRDHKSYPYG